MFDVDALQAQICHGVGGGNVSPKKGAAGNRRSALNNKACWVKYISGVGADTVGGIPAGLNITPSFFLIFTTLNFIPCCTQKI